LGKDDIDPVSENVAAAMGRPVFVLPKQDHIAHLKTHVAFLKSPLFGMNPAITKTYLYPIAQHLRDHLLNYYLVEAHEAVKKAETDELITDNSNEQVQVILQVQQFIEQQLGGFAQELAQLTEAAEQFKPQPPMPPDSSMQVAQIGAQVQQAALQQRAQSDQARLSQQQQIEAQKLQDKQAERDERMRQEELRQMAENERTAAELAARERMNTADNDTAMRLAAAEIATGERIAFSTGSGINPGV
jgi:uncharacterized protein with von Willebrand factor type A (vWA) domain